MKFLAHLTFTVTVGSTISLILNGFWFAGIIAFASGIWLTLKFDGIR
jgi:hypothetical protein